MNQEQNHPLYSTDRETVDRLLSRNSPNNSDFVDLARLFIRYENFPGAEDLKLDLEKILRFWKLSRSELNNIARKIWSDGFRPSANSEESIGSGFDTSDSN